MSRPTGSGWFAVAAASLFFLALIVSFVVDVRSLRPESIIRAWLGFVVVALTWWGYGRIKRGDKDPTVGQDTITFVVGLVVATVALISLFKSP